LCGLRWTPRPGKVQGIEKTCRLNPAESNFLDPASVGSPMPKSRPNPPRSLNVCDRQNLRPVHAPAQSLVMMQTWNQSCQWGGPQNFFFSEVAPSAGVRRGRDSRSDYGSPEGGAASRSAAPPCPLRDGRRICSGSLRLDRGLLASKRPIAAINQVAMGSAVTRHHDSPRVNVSSGLDSRADWPYRDLVGSPALARQADWPLGPSPSRSCRWSGQPGRMGPRRIVVIGNLVLQERCHP
jgi:hypothetical protein